MNGLNDFSELFGGPRKMTKSPGGWAPWISDPDPPQEPMSPKELKEFSRKVGELLDRKRREEAEATKQAPAPTSTSEPAPKLSIAELCRRAGFRELPPSGKGYVIPTGKRPDQRVRPPSKR
jgi:hypothetical protein